MGHNNSSLKMLGSIASGKWILHYSYLDDCIKANELLQDVKPYEWGNPDNDFLLNVKDQEKQLAATAFRWRKRIGLDKTKGPFSGIKAIVHTTDARKGAFKRLIVLGKGTVLENVKTPYLDAKGATHCLAEPKKLPSQKLDYEALAKQRVAVVGPLYIHEFLVSGPSPNVEDFILDDYTAHWKKYKQ